MNTKTLQWWLDSINLTKDERKLLDTFRNDSDTSSGDISKLKHEFFSRIPNSNLTDDYHLGLGPCATDHIKYLFKTYVDDDTLVVTSGDEHDHVKELVEQCKHSLTLSYYSDILKFNVPKIINEAKKYKKVFIYIIGTQISTGEITPQSFFEQLKSSLQNNFIEHIIVLDDVQGMFIVPRDYTLFDYVIGTGHSLSRNYDLGFLISKREIPETNVISWLDKYINHLDVFLSRKDKIMEFPMIMFDTFSKYLADSKHFKLLTNTAPHIFSVEVSGIKFSQEIYDMLDKYHIRIEGLDSEYRTLIRLRAQQFIHENETFIVGLTKLFNILDMELEK